MLGWLLGKTQQGPGIDERRKLTRRKIYCDVICHLPVEGQIDRDFKAVVTDIGVGGLKMRCFEALPKGTLLFLEYPEELQGVTWTRVQCQVHWSFKSKATFETLAGLRYAEPKQNMAASWVKFLLEDVGFTEDMLRERRRSIRVDVSLDVAIHAYDKSAGMEMDSEGQVVSLSPGGVLIVTLDPILEGRQVDLSFRGSELKDLKMNGKILRVVADKHSRKFLHSVAFQGVTTPQQKQVAAYMQKVLRSKPPVPAKGAKK
ncbi:MAG: PilZ domain-containing protein [Candidatus Eremiobacterota bacterium]